MNDQIRFVLGNAEELSKYLPVEPYDLIYSFGVLHHTPHPDRAFAELRQYAHDNTTLKIMVYHRYSWKVLWILLKYGKAQFWRTSEWIARYSEAQEGCPVTYVYSPKEIKEALRRAGWEVVEWWVDHIFPYRISDYVQYRYMKVWYFRWMPQWLFRALERRFGWHLCVTAKPI
ncbi:MAG: methyltransferase domain-containing protein [Bacteroidia bacterium]|nr:methyltransferase domain-containing protein [Bacteroidia bacterium]